MEQKAKHEEKISKKALSNAATFICEEYKRRKKNRIWLESRMKDIDRQLRMEPDVLYKRHNNGKLDRRKAWMPEVELPNQSQTLELLLADVKRMIFPESGLFFEARAYANDQFLKNFSENTDFVIGSEVDAPSQITIENVNHYAEGFVASFFKFFDHEKAWEMIIGEALKYSVGVGRARMVLNSVFVHESQETYSQTRKIPVIVPIALEDVYLDDNSYNYMAFGANIAGSVILKQRRKYVDILTEAKKQPEGDFMNGGWLLENVKAIAPEEDTYIDLLEYEGDIVFNDEDMEIHVPNVIITVLYGKNHGESKSEVVRIQYNEFPFCSYIVVPYHQEHIKSPYGSSPLIKGHMVQKSASEALNRLLQATILSVEPCLSYPSDDKYTLANNGLIVYPGAQWPTSGEVIVHEIGDPSAMLGVYSSFLQQYSDVTGVTPPRLGAQTVSHTTAYAKNQEIQQGAIRTIDFVRDIYPKMEKWLSLCYHMGRLALQGVDRVYIDEYKSYVNIGQDLLPEKVCFKVLGAPKPQEDHLKDQNELNAIMTAIQINQVKVQLGLGSPLNFDAIEREVLRRGGIIDVDRFTTVPAGTEIPPAVPQAGGGAGTNPSLTVALQGLQ